MPDRVPLSTLLSWAWVALTIETDNAFESASSARVGRCGRISLPMWTNGLRLIDDDGVTVDELRTAAGAECNIGGLERWRWVSVGEGTTGRRIGYGTRRGITGGTMLRPTPAGRYARRAWPRVVVGVEARWRDRFGAAVVETLREALSSSADQRRSSAHLSHLPWSPPEVNPSDGFRTHVIDAGHPPRDEDLPLAALLGQALTEVTLEQERESEVSLPLGADLLRVVDSGAVRIRDLPHLSGISREAVAMAVGFLTRRDLADVTADRTATLTPSGRDALDGYRHRSQQAAGEGLRGPLEELLASTDALAAGLQPPPGCWRAEPPYLAQTRRLVADPLGALPWQPMVLHRGGWPDGS